MNRFFRYLGYIFLSLIVSYISMKSDAESLLEKLSDNSIQITLTIIIAYGTISNFLLAQLVNFASTHTGDFNSIVKELKRSTRIVLILFIILFTILLTYPLLKDVELLSKYSEYIKMAKNADVFFTLFYCIYAFFDTLFAFFNIYQSNIDK